MALDTTAIKTEIASAFPSAVPSPPNDGRIVAATLRAKFESIVDFLADALDSATSTEALEDVVGAFMANSSMSGITMSYDDVNNRMVMTASGAGMTSEEIQDMIAAFLQQGSNITISYNDAGNVMTITAATYNDEAAMDAIAAMIAAGTHRGITITYNDSSNSITFDAGPAIVSLPTITTGATLTCTALDNRTNRTVLTGNVTFTTITIPANGQLVIFYQQAATGGPYSVTFPAGIIWPSATAPTMPTTASKHLRVTLTSDGTGIHGNYSTN